MNHHLLLPWQDPVWLAQAHDWIQSSLAACGFRPAGEIDQTYVRPWSTVMRVPTDHGLYFFKATAAYLPHEAALTRYLADLHPELLPELAAADLEHNWLLMADAGISLRQYVRSERSFARWDTIMPLFARLQQELASHTQQLLALGVPDRRLSRLPDLFEQLIADEPAMLIGEEDSLTTQEYEQLKASVPQFREMCRSLAELGIPESIHHDDFHDANIFLRDGRVLFTDWAESAVAHPFFSLVVMLRGAGNSLETFTEGAPESGPDTPEVVELRDLYLKQWSSFGSLSELRSAARIAERRLGYVNRALTWHHVNSHVPEDLRSEYTLAIPGYLKEYLIG